MCGRFTLAATLDQILARYGLMAAAAFDWKPRYNIAPTQDHPVIFAEDGERRIQPMRWGLIPSWTKELKGDGFINAKSETVAEKPSFRTAFKRRRCLIPADGFYEWQKPEIAQGPKTPFRITMKDGGIFSMAGLW
ncbi:MAG: SOS response-associated peptidase, partial [Armatimonadetes bacterium]